MSIEKRGEKRAINPAIFARISEIFPGGKALHEDRLVIGQARRRMTSTFRARLFSYSALEVLPVDAPANHAGEGGSIPHPTLSGDRISGGNLISSLRQVLVL